MAFSPQGIKTPLIVLVKEGMKSDIIQALRRRASDYLFWSTREAEVLSAIERVVKQMRVEWEKEKLTEELI